MNWQDSVSPTMRSRLQQNRHGRLTSDQWMDMVTEPLVWLVLLLAPMLMLLGPRLLISLRMIGLWLLVLAIVVVVPMALRAWRYARARVQFAQLYAGDQPVGRRLLFWRPLELYTESGEVVYFKKRLAPIGTLQPHRAYIVYYLRESDHNVLLSMAPAAHPDAPTWQPSERFRERYARRT